MYASYYKDKEYGIYMQRVGSHLEVTEDINPYPWQGGDPAALHFTFLPGA